MVNKLRDEIKLLENTIDDLSKEKILLLAKQKESNQDSKTEHQKEVTEQSHPKRCRSDNQQQERSTRTKIDQTSPKEISAETTEQEITPSGVKHADGMPTVDAFTNSSSVGNDEPVMHYEFAKNLSIQSLRDLPQNECILCFYHT